MRKIDIVLIALVVVTLAYNIVFNIIQKDFSEALGWTVALLWFIGYLSVKIKHDKITQQHIRLLMDLLKFCEDNERKNVEEQKAVGWSEEDEKIRTTLVKYFSQPCEALSCDISLVVTWLKRLPKVFCPQPHWKPSEEQMGALFSASTVGAPSYRNALKSLYNDLKKLRQQ